MAFPSPPGIARDGFAETVNCLALVTGSLGKLALDVMIMASMEFGEVCEPFVKGRGASSTMPQAVRQHASLMLDAIVQDLERATGPWDAD